MKLALQAGGSVELSEAAFGREFNEALVHQVVNAYQAAGRQGSRAHKSRSERRGGGRKPWRQKGTGRARAGSIRSPIWRGGGVTFAAKPQDHSQKVNRKMYQGAVRCILSELIRQNRLIALDAFSIDAPKTRALLDKLASLDPKPEGKLLLVADGVDRNLELAARNLCEVAVRDVAAIDPLSLVSFDQVLMTVGALKKLEEALA